MEVIAYDIVSIIAQNQWEHLEASGSKANVLVFESDMEECQDYANGSMLSNCLHIILLIHS